MNRLPIEKRAQIIGLLVEGMSMRAVTRVTGVLRISAIVDAHFSLIVDAVSARSWTVWGGTQVLW